MLKRRSFLKQSAGVTLGFMGLHKLVQTGYSYQEYENEVQAYGELKDDPYRIIDLPPGFSYKVVSRAGVKMSDGLLVPGKPDGMAAFKGPRNSVVLVRNHELSPNQVFEGPFGLRNQLKSKIPHNKIYDPGKAELPHLGGTTNVVFDPKSGTTKREFLSLIGTDRNCAGGPTPWGTWVTCEEPASVLPGEHGARGHGYNFEVPATSRPGLVDPIPLKDMGRFRHEAIAVDPKSGIVFETEDRDDGLIYRFIPHTKGKLEKGGKLQVLAIRGKKTLDTRNWEKPAGKQVDQGQVLDVHWLDIDDIDSDKDDLRARGAEAGAAIFARGEGMWYGKGHVYFACTNGGAIQKGQIWKYTPSPYEGTALEDKFPGKLELFIESPKAEILEAADNLCVAPWGDLVIAEDGSNTQYLRGVTPSGDIYTIARNRYSNSEFAGVCFAPNHPILFVNIQTPGITLAITGPWQTFSKTVVPEKKEA